MDGLPKIYLVRHGETEWSKSGRHTGRTDLPLTPEGEAAARALRPRLAKTEFARVLASPLKRASHTAELAGFAPIADPDLMEWNYGDYEGRTTEAIRKERPDWELFRDGCPGGESVAQMTERADGVARRLKALTGNVLIFSHGHFLRSLAARWVGQPLAFAQALLLSTATVSILDFGHHSLDEPAIGQWNA